ncbi:MAG: hypothetical protein FD135_181 [Comamonadaceae bacterium]|nr:MAG: hypothetical protein FD135_181 [Comamonadaceae bacterium]
MSSGGVTSKGELTFGSCIFTITEWPVGAKLTPPRVYTIPTEKCKMTVNTTNAKADGSTANRDVTLTIGRELGNPFPYPITVAADGTIRVVANGKSFATPLKGTVVQITGAGN